MSVVSVGADRSRVDAGLALRATRRGGDTALAMHGGGFPLALRRTGPHRVHLVGTGAWPLGGDAVALSVHVGTGARLELAAVAATIALPGRTTARSRFDVTVEVDAGATAIIDLGPTVVAAGAEHATSMQVRLAEGARFLMRELVVLGRTDETPGVSESRIDVAVATHPLIREVLIRPAGAAGPAVDAARRALAGMVAVGFAPAVSTAATPAPAGWLALPGRHGWRSIDLDDDVAALQMRDQARWRTATGRLMGD